MEGPDPEVDLIIARSVTQFDQSKAGPDLR